MEELKIKVLGIEGRRVKVKIGKQRKARSLIAFRTDAGRIIAQGEDCIFSICEESKTAVYNLKGGYFIHLNLALGARVAKVPEEFINALKEVLTKEGEIIGFLPGSLGGSPVIFGGAKEI